MCRSAIARQGAIERFLAEILVHHAALNEFIGHFVSIELPHHAFFYTPCFHPGGGPRKHRSSRYALAKNPSYFARISSSSPPFGRVSFRQRTISLVWWPLVPPYRAVDIADLIKNGEVLHDDAIIDEADAVGDEDAVVEDAAVNETILDGDDGLSGAARSLRSSARQNPQRGSQYSLFIHIVLEPQTYSHRFAALISTMLIGKGASVFSLTRYFPFKSSHRPRGGFEITGP